MSINHESLRRAGRALFRDGIVAREITRPLAIFFVNVALYGSLQVVILAAPWWFAKVAAGMLAGVVTSALFIIAHDCAHGSFTRSPLLNRVLGMLAMLPGLHPYSLWERGHNHVHHRFSLQIGKDNAFPPMSPQQFAKASQGRRLYYRFLRTPVGHLAFYMIEIWLPTMILPIKREVGPFKKIYAADLGFVFTFIVVLLAVLATLTVKRGMPLDGTMLGAIVLYHLAVPFLVWMMMISFLTVVQHTHPQARWRQADGAPSDTSDQANGSIHIVFPEWLDFILHRVMHHHAHHLQPAIPVYHLKKAQKILAGIAASDAAPFIAPRWSIRSHLDMAARCKLYDIDHDCWRDFAGRVTGRPQLRPAS